MSHAHMLQTFAQFELLQQKKLEAAKAVVSLDYDKALAAIGLEKMPFERRPCPVGTEKLHGIIEKMRKTHNVPLVNASIKWFLPVHSRTPEHKDAEDEDESESMKMMQKAMGVKRSKHALSFLHCLEALDCYIIAGAMLKQFDLASGLTHVAIIKEIAGRAVDDGRWHSVAVTYDELVRKKWADKAHMAGKGTFDVDAAMQEVDEKVYTQALGPAKGAAALASDTAGSSQAAYTGKTASHMKGNCHYCQKPGHLKVDCLKMKADQRNGGLKRFADASEGDGNKGRKHFKRY
jgi:hypothetical protein